MKIKKDILLAFNLVFSRNFSSQDVELLDDLSEADDIEQVKKILESAIKVSENDSDEIQSVLTNWKLERLSFIDKSILFLAIGKLKYLDTPANSTISEAVELAKLFSEKKSSKFINGVLDAWYNRYKREA